MRDKQGNYIGPETGHVYLPGERINPEIEGIGCTGHKSSPSQTINGKECYKRIFIKRKHFEEIIQELDFENPVRMQTQLYCIAMWFHDFANESLVLEFIVHPPTEDDLSNIEDY